MLFQKALFVIFSFSIFILCNYLVGMLCLGRTYAADFIQNGGNLLLEVARGIFCFFVFLGHTVLAYNFLVSGGEFWPPPDIFKTINYLAAVGIDGFFVITGYLFAAQVARGVFPRNLLLKRVKRLIPPFILVTATIVLIRALLNIEQNYLDGFFVWISPLFIYKLPIDYVIFGHYWSLRNEWLFYLFVIVVLYFSGKFRFPILFFLLVVASVIDSTFSMILIGVSIYILIAINNKYIKLLTKGWFICIATVVFLLYLFFAPFQEFPSYVRYALRLGVTFIFCFAFTAVEIPRIKSNYILKFVSYSGAPAYSLYLFHGFVLYLVLSNWPKGVDLFAEFNYLVLMVILIPLWVISSWLFFWVAERPYHLSKIK